METDWIKHLHRPKLLSVFVCAAHQPYKYAEREEQWAYLREEGLLFVLKSVLDGNRTSVHCQFDSVSHCQALGSKHHFCSEQYL